MTSIITPMPVPVLYSHTTETTETVETSQETKVNPIVNYVALYFISVIFIFCFYWGIRLLIELIKEKEISIALATIFIYFPLICGVELLIVWICFFM